MRTAFIQTLCEQAKQDERIFLICGDLGYSVLEVFADNFPDRFLNAGIAEQNMMQVAAGLSMEGYTVFTYSIGNFPTLRCMEQIRYDICYHDLNVKIVAVGAGYAYGALGTSHHTTEDIAMLRSIPGMRVTAPGDPVETRWATTRLCQDRGPAYLRLNKAGEQVCHTTTPDINTTAMIQLRTGRNTVVLSTGAVLPDVLQQVQARQLNHAVYSVPFISDIDPAQLAAIANNYDHIITIEEHQLHGGFGSAILEHLSDLHHAGKLTRFPTVERVGIPNVFQKSAGSQQYLRQQSGIVLP
jgi:transketolase